MKGNLIAFGMKLCGLSSVWDKIDGAKTYLGASAEMLSGLSAIMAALGTLINTFMGGTHNLGDVVNFVLDQMSHKSPPVLAIGAGWLLFLHGWGVMAKKSAEDKKHSELLAASAPVAAAVVVPVAVATSTADAPKA